MPHSCSGTPCSSDISTGPVASLFVEGPAAPSADPDRWHLYESQAKRLREDLESWLRSDRSGSPSSRTTTAS